MEFTFEDFKKRAANPLLSKWEKIGFPDSYREGVEEHIYFDIRRKLDLEKENLKILDIGCGCSNLVNQIIIDSKIKNSSLFLVDSEEMLNNINPDICSENTHLIPGYFPKIDLFNYNFNNHFDRILIYSVIQYVFLEQNIYEFIHKCIDLLKSDGMLLIGDIPNISSRDRFIQCEEGRKFLTNKFQNSVKIEHEKQERIDDSIVISIISRFRNFGCETYILPQPKNLPFGNRREDILIIKR
jgi:cyclopropane fatty-acyl-phospholipid synthase-like methyltransferase